MINNTIYTYDTTTHQIMIVFLVCLILLLIGIGAHMVIRSTFVGMKTEDGTFLKYKDWELASKILFRYAPLLILTIGVLGLTRLAVVYYNYGHQMEQGKYEIVTGDVEIISCEEDWYRDSFMGYEVIFEVDGERFTPCNSFDEDVVSALRSDSNLRIYYGYMKDGMFIWQIDVLS